MRMKKFWLALVWLAVILPGQAQQGKNLQLHWLRYADNEKGHWISENFEVQPLAGNPFINLQVAVYGQGTGKGIRVFVRTGNKRREIPADDLQPQADAWFGYTDLPNRRQDIRLEIVKVPGVDIQIRRIHLRVYWPGKTSALQEKALQNQGESQLQSVCNCPYPQVVTRDQWCPNNACPPQSNPVHTEVKFLIVHHTATPNNESDWAARVRQIWDFHVHTRGWADIGYNYLIDQNGLMYVGRGEDIKGAHFSGHNSETCGIAYLGTFNTFQPPAVMHDKFVEYAAFKCCQKNLDPLGTAHHASSGLDLHTIAGHRDSGSGTECPGDALYAKLPLLRQRTDSTMCTCSGGVNLAIVDSEYSTAEIHEGDSLTFTVRIKNQSANDFTGVGVQFKVDDQTVVQQSVDLAACANARASAHLSATGSGWHRACAVVDVQNGESNTSDNTDCFDFRIIGEEDLLRNYVLYPNPATGFVEVKVPASKGLVSWTVISLSGKEIKRFPGAQRLIKVDFLHPGVYLVRLEPVKGDPETLRLQVGK